MYDTMPLPAPHWKLSSWEERFGPCQHSPLTEGQRCAAQRHCVDGRACAPFGGAATLACGRSLCARSNRASPPRWWLTRPRPLHARRNPDLAPGLSHHDGPIPVHGPPAPGLKPGFRLYPHPREIDLSQPRDGASGRPALHLPPHLFSRVVGLSRARAGGGKGRVCVHAGGVAGGFSSVPCDGTLASEPCVGAWRPFERRVRSAPRSRRRVL